MYIVLFCTHASTLLSVQVMRDVVNCIHNVTSRIVIMDRKRKLESAARLQLRWQRWEITNYDYLMQVCCGRQHIKHSGQGKH